MPKTSPVEVGFPPGSGRAARHTVLIWALTSPGVVRAVGLEPTRALRPSAF